MTATMQVTKLKSTNGTFEAVVEGNITIVNDAVLSEVVAYVENGLYTFNGADSENATYDRAKLCELFHFLLLLGGKTINF